MNYMLLVYSAESAWTKEEWTQCTRDSAAICHELIAKGQFRSASPLHPLATARSVRVRAGKPVVTTGPFAETTEQLGGYFLIDVADLDEAIAVATQLPGARRGTVEIRPLLPLPGLPDAHFGDHTDRNKYMLLCYDDKEKWQAEGEGAEHAAMLEAVELTVRLDRQGYYYFAAPLESVALATSVRVRNGRGNVTDGPFAETREVLGGFYIVTTPTAEEAIAIAAEHPGARLGTVEVRQIFDLPSQLA